MPLQAGESPEKPVCEVKKGATVITIQGVTRHWKDVDKTPLDKRPKPRQLRPVLNFDPPLPEDAFKRHGKVDRVVQRTYTGKANDPDTVSVMPDPTKSFAGMNLNSNGAGWPPDTNGDVGLNYYIQTVNTSIGIYSKSDGSKVSTATFNSFFGGTGISGTPCDNSNRGDPIVLFDQY
ncbi:MAG: hypothetical protein GY757_57355, partial [bacterium]|nr:hypothetical protein [bacterium]